MIADAFRKKPNRHAAVVAAVFFGSDVNGLPQAWTTILWAYRVIVRSAPSDGRYSASFGSISGEKTQTAAPIWSTPRDGHPPEKRFMHC